MEQKQQHHIAFVVETPLFSQICEFCRVNGYTKAWLTRRLLLDFFVDNNDEFVKSLRKHDLVYWKSNS